MSTSTTTTTTANPLTHQTTHLLADYQLTHSPHHNTIDTSPTPSSSLHAQPSPTTWPTAEHRRVPAYRAVNTALDQSERRVYLNGVERTFVAVMFTGVYVQSTISKVWRNSLGRAWNVGYKLGGEW